MHGQQNIKNELGVFGIYVASDVLVEVKVN